MKGADLMLSVENLHAGYGPIEVLTGVSISVRRGEIATLIGANGAGKSTTLMCISGINRVRSGRILLDGEEVHGLRADQLVHRGLSQVPEGRKIFPRLTVIENLEMGAFSRVDRTGISGDMDRVFHLFPVLRERRSQYGGTLSGGEQQMLAIGRALMSRPKMLLMDEPSMGIAPMLVLKIFDVIRELNEQGMTILLVEQNARLALMLANFGYVLKTGKIFLADKASALLSHPQVQEAYLGKA